jgi:hypothetical protein
LQILVLVVLQIDILSQNLAHLVYLLYQVCVLHFFHLFVLVFIRLYDGHLTIHLFVCLFLCDFIGLTLRSGDIGAAAEAWPVGLFGLV